MFGWLKRSGPKPGSTEYAKRQLLEAATEAYKLARRDRPRSHYQPMGYSGDAAIIGSQDLMNRRTRDIVRNTAQGKKIVTRLSNLIIGSGCKTFSWPFSPTDFETLSEELELLMGGQLGPRLRYALESDDLFETYCNDPKQFDIEGRLSAPMMFRMAVRETVTVGSALIVRTIRSDFDPARHIVPVAWQLIERERLDTSQDRSAFDGQNKIVGGIEFDSTTNAAVAYYVLSDHPHDGLQMSSESIRIDAERVIDLSLYDRPSSGIGASWLDAGGQSTWDRDSYMESELRTAAVESVFLLVAKLTNGETFDGQWGFTDDTDDSDTHGNREYKVGHSPVAATVGVNESIEMVKPTRPNRDAGPFVKLIDHDIANSVGLSYFDLTGDYQGANFTSTRGAKLDQETDIEPLQQWFNTIVAIPIRRTFNAFAVAGGRLRSVSPSQFEAEIATYNRFDVIGAGRDLLDPYKEGEARTTRLRTRVSTYKEEMARRGKHWIRELMQHAIEERMFDVFGVAPDVSKGGGEGGTRDDEQTAEQTDDGGNESTDEAP